MKTIATSLSISALMMATRSRAKLRLFCAISLLAGLTWRRWRMICGSMPGVSDGDHANTSLLFLRKAVSSTFFFGLKREPICTFLFALSRSRCTSSTSSSSFHPSSGVTSRRIPSSWSWFFNCYWGMAIPFPFWFARLSRTGSASSLVRLLPSDIYVDKLCLLAFLQPLS